MRNFILIMLTVLAVWVASLAPSARAAESVPVKSGRAVAQLVTSYDTASPGQDIYIALSLRLEKHWHTYWRNAGGPGYPAELHFEVLGSPSDSLRFGDIIWPVPKTVLNKAADPSQTIISYAFEDRLLLPIALHISKDAKPAQVITIQAQATYLVCDDICLPEIAELTLPLVIGKPVKDGRWSANIERAIKQAPKPEGLQASAALIDGALHVDIAGGNLDFSAIKNPYFFPYEQDLIEASAEQIIVRGKTGLRFNLEPSFGLEDGIKTISGVLAFDEKTGDGHLRRGIEVVANAGSAVDIGAPKSILSPAKTRQSITHRSIGFPKAIIWAFIGGMILNLMPCVFPVLSLKVLGFARTAHDDRKTIRKHGWIYTLGVIASFLVLAGVLLFLKAGGAKVGWGFQFQNPVLVGALALLFFTIALNMFGMFEIGGRFQNTGSGLASSGGNKGAFFTGVLAVVVASPCMAPLMGVAIGFALTQSTFVTLAVFTALGAGLALPFLLLSHAPGLLTRLPKPGPWMNTFKQFLAFPMLAAAVWLVWVLSEQTGAGGVVAILSSMLAVGFAVWLWQRGGQREGQRGGVLAQALFVLSVLFAAYSVGQIGTAEHAMVINEATKTQAWSRGRVAELRAEGHVVFVDFTAAWCVSCKVNDKVVLQRRATKDLFARTNTKVLVGDWTRRDDAITEELERHGRSGVPLYLVFAPGSDAVEPQILPQVLSYKILEKALEKAKQD